MDVTENQCQNEANGSAGARHVSGAKPDRAKRRFSRVSELHCSMRLAAVARQVAAPRHVRRRAASGVRLARPLHVTAATSSVRGPSSSSPFPAMGKVLDETVAYDRYLTVFDRTVEFPEDGGLTVKYDLVGHPRANFRFAVIFPFHPKDSKAKTPAKVTVIREYIQASNSLGYSLPTGGFNPKKHTSLSNAASDELAEEARLEGSLIDMLDAIDPEHPGFVEGKWCSNRFRPYLAVDPKPMANPPKRDKEEFSIETNRVTFPELKRLMYSGEMMVPSIVTANMAIERLLKEGHDLGL
jgi:hypothetical protein